MHRSASYPIVFLATLLLSLSARGQDVNYDSLLQRIDTIANPVYKPVISLSYGVLNFRGDVRNSLISPVSGNQAGRLNVTTYIGRNNYYAANFSFLVGRLTANEYSHSDLSRNLNFQTDLYSIGLNLEYRFGHFIDKSFFVRPFVSLGIESINFSSKGDLMDASGMEYNYWSDGSIRDIPESGPGTPEILYRDYIYETDLRLRESTEFDLGSYSQRSLAIPAELGLHFYMSRRAFFSLGFSYHYAFTDFIDNVAAEGTSIVGNKGNDSFVFTNLSMHFDLFSDPETRTVDLLFAEADFDPLFYDDEDGDFVLDLADQCPGTPYGVQVDSMGCPLDGDDDMVPDYLDKELDSDPNAWVDEDGVTISEEEYQASLALRDDAMAREDVELYFATIRSDYRMNPVIAIPEKFQTLDEDQDGYISFDELLKTVDQYFDFELDLDLGELRELNGFFFSQ